MIRMLRKATAACSKRPLPLWRGRTLQQRREEEFQRGEISADKLQNCVRALGGPRQFLGFGEPVRSTIDV